MNVYIWLCYNSLANEPLWIAFAFFERIYIPAAHQGCGNSSHEGSINDCRFYKEEGVYTGSIKKVIAAVLAILVAFVISWFENCVLAFVSRLFLNVITDLMPKIITAMWAILGTITIQELVASFLLIAGSIISMVIVVAWAIIKRYTQPVSTAVVKVVKKNADITVFEHDHTSIGFYMVTFLLVEEVGRYMTLRLPKAAFDSLKEGEIGRLSYRGDTYLSFTKY